MKFDVSKASEFAQYYAVIETNVVRAFTGEVSSAEAKEALRTADELADLIIFHANARENAQSMSETWEM